MQDFGSCEQTQEALALQEMLALTSKSAEDGRVRPVAEAFAGIRERVRKRGGISFEVPPTGMS